MWTRGMGLAINSTPSNSGCKELFGANCAACHGKWGQEWVFAAGWLQTPMKLIATKEWETSKSPADFTDASRMLSASPAHLQGKLIRGGMGTGMPYWGPIFNEDQTWALIAYLWTFRFQLEVRP
jgi:mono/diheme cytochrome c family protein